MRDPIPRGLNERGGKAPDAAVRACRRALDKLLGIIAEEVKLHGIACPCGFCEKVALRPATDDLHLLMPWALDTMRFKAAADEQADAVLGGD